MRPRAGLLSVDPFRIRFSDRPWKGGCGWSQNRVKAEKEDRETLLEFPEGIQRAKIFAARSGLTVGRHFLEGRRDLSRPPRLRFQQPGKANLADHPPRLRQGFDRERCLAFLHPMTQLPKSLSGRSHASPDFWVHWRIRKLGYIQDATRPHRFDLERVPTKIG